jgi:hypothetical protein
VIFDRFYKNGTGRDVGSLYQLKCAISRKNVVNTVTKDYHADSAFVDIAGESHVVAAALNHFGMEDVDSKCTALPPALQLAELEFRKRVLRQIVGEMIDNLVMNGITQNIAVIDGEEDIAPDNEDSVKNYSCNFLKMWLIRRVSILATRSGDGMRLLRHWKYAMLVYHAAHKVKYRLEAFLLLAGTLALHTPRVSHQIIWNRFINLSGGQYKNLDGDYVMELLNKYAKSRVKLLGPNHSSETVMRIGKTMMFSHEVTHNLENEVKAAPVSRDHKFQDKKADLLKLVGILKNARVFCNVAGRTYNSFNETKDLFFNFQVGEFQKWLSEKKKEYQYNKHGY